MKNKLITITAALLAAAAVALAAPLTYTVPIDTGDSNLVIANKHATAVANGDAASNITTATTTVVKTGAGVLSRLVVNTAGAGSTFTIYDNTAASGTKIATGTSAAQTVLLYNVRFGTGLTVVTASGTPADITVGYR